MFDLKKKIIQKKHRSYVSKTKQLPGGRQSTKKTPGGCHQMLSPVNKNDTCQFFGRLTKLLLNML